MKTFEIFDVNNPLMSKNDLINSDTHINSVKQYLKQRGLKYKPKRSGSNFVQISAREVIKRDGDMYYKGNCQWYELI